jgi:hypothetical protein
MCHLSVFAGIYTRNLLFRLFGGKSAVSSLVGWPSVVGGRFRRLSVLFANLSEFGCQKISYGEREISSEPALRIGDRQSTLGVVGRNCRGSGHLGSACPVLSAELAISRIPTSCFARAAVPTRTEGARFAPRLPPPTRARASSAPAASLFGIRRSSATPGRDRDR